MELTYKRILLKISGEVLAGGKGMGIDYDTVLNICSAVKECVDMGVRLVLSSAAATSGADVRAVIWTEPELTTWVCSPPL